MAQNFFQRPTFQDYARAEEEFLAKKRERALKNQLVAEKIKSGGAVWQKPAALQLANEYLAAKKAGDTDRANAIESFAKTRDKDLFMTQSGSYAPLPGLPEARERLSASDEAGKQMMRSAYEPDRARQVAQAQADVQAGSVAEIERQKMLGSGKVPEREKRAEDRKSSKISADFALRSENMDMKNISGIADSLLKRADIWTTGMAGSLGQFVPGSPQHDFARDLDTVVGESALAKLVELKNSSDTGASGLGQVTEREIAILQRARSALDQSQSPEQFKSNLRRYIALRKAAYENIERSYNERFGGDGQTQDLGPQPEGTNATKPRLVFDPETGDFQ